MDAMNTVERHGDSMIPAVSIPQLDIRSLSLTVIGRTCLISNRLPSRRTGDRANDRFADSLYWLTDQPRTITTQTMAAARFGYPTTAFKIAAMLAAESIDGLKRNDVRRLFVVRGDLVEIHGTPIRREDTVWMNGRRLYVSAMFPEWRATLDVAYRASTISEEQIVRLFHLAGLHVGVGPWRPEKGGEFGQFSVSTEADRKAAI